MRAASYSLFGLLFWFRLALLLFLVKNWFQFLIIIWAVRSFPESESGWEIAFRFVEVFVAVFPEEKESPLDLEDAGFVEYFAFSGTWAS